MTQEADSLVGPVGEGEVLTTSPDEAGTPSDQGAEGEEPLKLFTQAEADEYAEGIARQRQAGQDKRIAELNRWVGLGKMASDDLAKIRQENEGLRRQLDSLQGEHAKLDPNMFDAVQLDQENRTLKGQLEQFQRTRDLERLSDFDDIELAKGVRLLATAQSVAEEYGIKAEVLLKAGLQTEEQMRAFADAVKAHSPRPEDGSEADTEGREALAGAAGPRKVGPNSGVGSGGGRTWKDVQRLYSQGSISTEEYIKEGNKRGIEL